MSILIISVLRSVSSLDGVQRNPGKKPRITSGLLPVAFSLHPVFSLQPTYNAKPHRRLRARAGEKRKIGQRVQRLDNALIMQFH